MIEFVVGQGSSFAFQHYGNSIAYRIGQTSAAGNEFLSIVFVFKVPFGYGANEKFK
jgi:hypothetical protein